MTDDAVTSEGSQSKVTQAAGGVLSGRELDAAIAEKVMGLEVLDLGYFGTEEETPRMVELHDWLDEVAIESVGIYAIDVQSKTVRNIEVGGWSPGTAFNPSTDLNACFEAQARCIEKWGIGVYAWHLSFATPEGNPGHNLMLATAEQRCRAMLACSYNKGRA